MRKIFPLLVQVTLIAIFCSCGSNSTSENNSASKESLPMKYTVLLEGDFGMSANVIVYEYTREGDRFHQNQFTIKNGESRTFTAQKGAYKVKVYGEVWPWDVKGWVELVYILSEGETKVISLNDHTKFFRMEP